MEYREKKFKGAGENGKKSWKKENAGRNGNNGRNVNGKTERNSGRKETQNFVSGTEKRNGRNYGNQDKSVEKKLGYIDEKLEKKYGGAWNPTGEKNVNAGDKKKAASAAKRQDYRKTAHVRGKMHLSRQKQKQSGKNPSVHISRPVAAVSIWICHMRSS